MHVDCLNDNAYKHTENKHAEFVINFSHVYSRLREDGHPVN